jgi:predicted phosphate transport protein (TIGR00153 family)
MAGLNSILKIFLPKDRVFFQLFENVADVLVTMSQKLKEIVHEPDFEKRAKLIKEVEDMEHINDDYTHQIFTELGKNFITPFDREDIHYLATALDDIADYIYASVKKINFYRVNPNDPGIHKFAEIIGHGCGAVNNAVKELRNMKNLRQITDALVAINSFENQADDVFDMSIERLFAEEPDAKEVIKKREIYQVMEIVTDKCEDAANVIESIIVKYA